MVAALAYLWPDLERACRSIDCFMDAIEDGADNRWNLALEDFKEEELLDRGPLDLLRLLPRAAVVHQADPSREEHPIAPDDVMTTTGLNEIEGNIGDQIPAEAVSDGGDERHAASEPRQQTLEISTDRTTNDEITDLTSHTVNEEFAILTPDPMIYYGINNSKVCVQSLSEVIPHVESDPQPLLVLSSHQTSPEIQAQIPEPLVYVPETRGTSMSDDESVRFAEPHHKPKAQTYRIMQDNPVGAIPESPVGHQSPLPTSAEPASELSHDLVNQCDQPPDIVDKELDRQIEINLAFPTPSHFDSLPDSPQPERNCEPTLSGPGSLDLPPQVIQAKSVLGLDEMILDNLSKERRVHHHQRVLATPRRYQECGADPEASAAMQPRIRTPGARQVDVPESLGKHKFGELYNEQNTPNKKQAFSKSDLERRKKRHEAGPGRKRERQHEMKKEPEIEKQHEIERKPRASERIRANRKILAVEREKVKRELRVVEHARLRRIALDEEES